ncbi:MAG: hypothetical protein KKG47_02310 [Proteobacteria bacterium]|nr:hypothetical protein [Pseudomonadota bacterium]MBU1737412.1 hypothetical protein [Pseudomonadota bacterium]
MLKKVEIILWTVSAAFSFGVFLAVIHTEILTSYAKLFAAILPVVYINAVGVHIWNRIK